MGMIVIAALTLGIALALVGIYLLTCIHVLNEYERGVIFRWKEERNELRGTIQSAARLHHQA